MYQISLITGTFKKTVKAIQEVNEAIKQLCEESATQQGIDIVSELGMNNERILKIRLSDGENGIEFTIRYMKLIEEISNFKRNYSNDLPNLTTKDKIITIIESRAVEVATEFASNIC